MRTTIRGQPPGVSLVNIDGWRNSRSASADLWVEPQLAADVDHISGLIAVAGRLARSMDADSMELVVPGPIGDMVVDGFDAEPQPLEMGDPWLRKTLSG